MFFRLHPNENVTSNLIRDFLHQVRLQLDGQMTVLWDRASVRPPGAEQGVIERLAWFSRIGREARYRWL